MTKLPRPDRPAERDDGEKATGTPPASTEKETSRRPAGTSRSDRLMDEHDFMRQKELNPDDFE
jgi:hypothetical protein